MDAKQFADEIVDPTITDFEREPSSRRRAFLACVATFHLVDYIPKKPRERYRRECPAFAAVDRYANAFKHSETGDLRNPLIKPLKAGQIFERPPAFCGVMRTGASFLGDKIGGVSVAGEPGPYLLPVVKEAAAFLRSKLPT
jgi:hypothetical protein